ncbi:helix-turn-helix domain-containing protein [Nocardioides sp. dk4132]|uniref:IclR family transcriptional regulator n=1 Tax=unclassified Nocardioides TaxID=2615069 RepID=UPI0012964862|nr:MULTISPECIES: IclR family transcriptional regulator [unclassified Nocardioides]MQW76808.1 helix-turn-helix domain-containing protein [Nocardioides sp. dk4132]QGA06841.1 helix-turn-helix domain-containing protein [Nocardioides sp. dk884]
MIPARPVAPGATIATVERAADMLLHLAREPRADHGVTEVAEAMGLSKSAVHRVLTSLRRGGLVELDERTRRYSLGVGALRLGLSYLDRIDVRRLARPVLEDLAERTGETATLSVLLGERDRIYVDQVTPEREVIMSVSLGEPYPLHAGASSRVFLAFLPDAQRERYLAGGPLASVRAATIVDDVGLREDLLRVRAQGWARSAGERQDGAASVAAPVLRHDGSPAAVISVCGPASRFAAELDHCRELLLEATRSLSAGLGWMTQLPH